MGISDVRLAGLLLSAVALVAVACGTRPSTTSPSSPTVNSPSPLAFYSLYEQDSADALATIHSVDWNGNPGPTIHVDQSAGVGGPKNVPLPRGVMTVSPDGSKLLVDDGTVLDGDGKTIGQWDQRAGINFVWADNDQLCFLTTAQFPAFTGGTVEGDASLETMAVGSAPRVVAGVGRFDAQGRIRILACNSESDRAIVVRTEGGLTNPAMTGIGAVSKLQVIQLSTGAVLYERAYDVSAEPPGGTEVAASPDGRYIAEVAKSLRASLAGSSVIRELATDRIVATLPDVDVAGFSTDGLRVVTQAFLAPPVAPKGTIDVAVVDWKTGTTVWHQDSQLGVAPPLASPESESMFLRIGDALWLVRDAGESVMIPGHVAALYEPDNPP